MRTIIVLQVDHARPIPKLANLIAGRAWTIGGVERAEVLPVNGIEPDLEAVGFTPAEIALGRTEVERG